MNGYTQCPACGSLRTHVTKGEFKASGFQAFGNRVCDRCGTAWRPRCPRWAAIVSIVAGCVVLALGVTCLFFTQPGTPNFSDAKAVKGLVTAGFFAVMGLWACAYGMAVLSRRTGELKILGKVLAAPAAPEISEPGSNALTDGRCVGCQRPISSGSAYCPHCGRPQPS